MINWPMTLVDMVRKVYTKCPNIIKCQKIIAFCFSIFNKSLFTFVLGKAYARQCETNSKKTCACQGTDNTYSGASFTFGCSWCMYYDGCKYGKGGMNKVKKFKLTNNNETSLETDNWRNQTDKGGLGLKERNLENTVNHLADQVGNLFENVVPQAFKNMTCRGGQAEKCRIGDSRKSGDERPFSGVTAVSDFCAHAHRGLFTYILKCLIIFHVCGDFMNFCF